MIRIFNQYVSPKSLLLMFIEGLLIALALLCGVRLRFWTHPDEVGLVVQFPDIAIQGLLIVLIFQLCFYYSDLYYIFPRLLIGRGIFVISVFLVAAFVTVNRVVLDRTWQIAAPKQNILILGTQAMAVNVARQLIARDDLNVKLIGFIEARRGDSGPEKAIFGIPVLDAAENLEATALEHHVARI